MDWAYSSDDDLFPEVDDVVEKNTFQDSTKIIDPSAEHLEVLRKHFGHNNFRPLQWEIIRTVIYEKRDQCVLMATGSGKSLCFQYPPVFTGGCGIVISPLISLMEDQVLALEVAGIKGCYLGSAQTQSAKIQADILKNKYRLIYLTPEFCNGENGVNLLEQIYKKLNITLIAIDEAHCISKWGHDFRSSYRTLGRLRTTLPDVPILAVTATATQQVQVDICTEMKMVNPELRLSSFDRPNLYFKIQPKNNILEDIRSCLKGVDGSVIVYTITKKDTESICKILKLGGIECGTYHAGMPLGQRKKIHEKFTKDEIKVIVATVAFGMGIDKPDVRVVIHYGASKDLESYYQEVGRAGRDGLPAKCITFYGSGDFAVHDKLRSISTANETALKHSRKLGIYMKNFIYSNECRRKLILEYFNNKNSKVEIPKHKICCDNCDPSNKQSPNVYSELDAGGKYDFTLDIQLLLEVIQLLNGRFGLGMYIKFIRGLKTDRIPERTKSNPLYGSGKNKTEVWWKIIGRIAESKGLLKKVNFSMGCTIELSKQGITYLKEVRQDKSLDLMKLKPPADVIPFLKRKIEISDIDSDDEPITFKKVTMSSIKDVKHNQENVKPCTSTSSTNPKPQMAGQIRLYQDSDPQELKDFNTNLFANLKKFRNDIAHQTDCMPYMISNDVALMEMVNILPATLDHFAKSKFNNFNETKIAKFGPQFVGYIKMFIETHGTAELNLKINNLKEEPDKHLPKIQDLLRENPHKNFGSGMNASANTSLSMFLKFLDVEQVAKQRQFSPSTVKMHLRSALENGYPLKLGQHLKVDPNVVRKTVKVLATGPTKLISDTKMTIYKESLPDVDWDSFNYIYKYIEVRQYLTTLKKPYLDHEPIPYQMFLDFRATKSSTTEETVKDSQEISGTSFYKSPNKPSKSDAQLLDNDFPMSKAELDLVDALTALAEEENKKI